MAGRGVAQRTAFSVGMRVSHEMFGEGIIFSVDGNRLEVNFSCGTKRILSHFVEIM